MAGKLRGGAVISTEAVARGGVSNWITLDLL